ncbi:MAG: hypothetical protein JSV19_09725 [Phycisphaerales bacterium]|nr:MAG: hypothetical protein JSV19_09725 [Phycisphaerales bacterium]
MGEAIGVVNDNAAGVTGGLQGLGSARGYVTLENGDRRNFDCDANLLVIAPRHLRLDLQSLGQTQVLFGSNDALYWLHVKPEIDTYWWGRYGGRSIADLADIPLRPDMIVEATGLAGLPVDSIDGDGPVQRIDGEHQQLLYIAYDQGGHGLICKEYWLSRRGCRLIDQIVFRDRLGRVVMRSRLAGYKRLKGDGPWLAHHIDVVWPEGGAQLQLKVRQWKAQAKLTPKHRGFVAPHERGKTFATMIDIDQEPQQD